VIYVDPERFEGLVASALDSLPGQLGAMMRNVAVTVKHNLGPRGLLGLCQGVPLTSPTSSCAGVLPDRITIHCQAICAVCWTGADVAGQAARPSLTRSGTISVSAMKG
jgi:predicted Zn-dependent protease with MMP-like domain